MDYQLQSLIRDPKPHDLDYVKRLYFYAQKVGRESFLQQLLDRMDSFSLQFIPYIALSSPVDGNDALCTKLREVSLLEEVFTVLNNPLPHDIFLNIFKRSGGYDTCFAALNIREVEYTHYRNLYQTISLIIAELRNYMQIFPGKTVFEISEISGMNMNPNEEGEGSPRRKLHVWHHEYQEASVSFILQDFEAEVESDYQEEYQNDNVWLHAMQLHDAPFTHAYTSSLASIYLGEFSEREFWNILVYENEDNQYAIVETTNSDVPKYIINLINFLIDFYPHINSDYIDTYFQFYNRPWIY